jgi:colanic acid biosynthesis glycosyl transferase WcaI
MTPRPDAPDDILILTRHYAPEPTGSAPPMQQIAEWLAGQGHGVRLTTVRPSYPTPAIFEGYAKGERDRVVENGVQVLRLPAQPVKGAGLLARMGPEARFMIDLMLGAVTGRIRRSDKTISLCPSILTTLGALALARRGGRHVAIVHDVQSGLGSALGSAGLRAVLPILKRLEAFALNRADHVVVLSSGMQRAVQALGVRRPIAIRPPSIDTRAIVPAPRPEGAPPTLMYSGNLGRKQGLEQLLDLAAVLMARGSPIRICIRGDGASREALVAEAERRTLTNLAFLPLAPKEQFAASLAEGDVHLVPQIADGGDFAVPSKVFAVMAAGRPFVATALPGSSLDHLAQTSGAFVCVEPNQPEAFADQVQALMADEGRRAQMGRNGRDYVIKEVDTDVVMRRLLPLLDAGLV